MKSNQLNRKKPLAGKTIVLTRSFPQSKEFSSSLLKFGARVLLCPAIRTIPRVHTRKAAAVKQQLIKNPVAYEWIIFMSANGVRFLAELMGKSRALLKQASIFAIGPKTTDAIHSFGWSTRKMAKEFNSTGVLNELRHSRHARLLVPRVVGGPKEFIRVLQRKGARVTELGLYRTVSAPHPSKGLKRKILSDADGLVFTSPSTVRFFRRFFTRREFRSLLQHTTAFSIGPSTTGELVRIGVKKIVESRQSTGNDLLHTVISAYRKAER